MWFNNYLGDMIILGIIYDLKYNLRPSTNIYPQLCLYIFMAITMTDSTNENMNYKYF